MHNWSVSDVCLSFSKQKKNRGMKTFDVEVNKMRVLAGLYLNSFELICGALYRSAVCQSNCSCMFGLMAREQQPVLKSVYLKGF